MQHINLEGKQKEVMALPAEGHNVVLGTAGSGKTTLAILRAQHLSNLHGKGKVLLITFNGALVKFMEGKSGARSPKLTVENYHKFARGYLRSRGKIPSHNGILDNTDTKQRFIKEAIEYCKSQNPEESTLKRSIDFFMDEISFIEKFGFSDAEEYKAATRIGRASANVKRENRKWIFDVYKKFLDLRKAAGYEYDWDDLAYYAFRELQKDSSPRKYSHIIIDEGQDFSPMMIRSLVLAVRPGGSFTFFGDVAQQIYGSRLSWRDSGIDTTDPWIFEMNYRNPASIVSFATDITNSDYWLHDTDMISPSVHVAEGPKPALIRFEDKARELAWVVSNAIASGKSTSAVIILRDRAIVRIFLRKLRAKGCTAIEIDKNTPGYAESKTVYVSTYHAAKGLEFNNVYVPLLNEEHFPDRGTVEKATDEKIAYADEIKLLYVAATRSKFGLFMTYHGTLSPLFPVDVDSYDTFDGETI